MSTLAALRQHFLDFFARHHHTVVPSAPVVPQQDDTLLFTNAGMVPFKDYFTGLQEPPFARATSVQKCIRAGGKHNDLEQVGYTRRHHTFFEMLGNFSWGSYLKEEAISLAWAFVHQELGLSRDRLWVTVYHEDQEARDLWMKLAGLPQDRIIPIATHDNFWAMGDIGPCGPCSEIFYDHGPHIEGGLPGTLEADGDRYMEIWNLVFMQDEQHGSGERTPLPRPCIDTGMGLERMAAVLQGVSDTYQIDVFQRLLMAVGELSGTHPDQPSHKVIVDHLRSAAFIMADGVLPSNEGRGYVLRRILRRAIRHIHRLAIKNTFLYTLVPSLVDEMGTAYPELKRAQSLIEVQMRLEEEKFRETLERGLKILHTAIEALGMGQVLSGQVAFQLYDTYGFPVDLTQNIVQEHGLTMDLAGFEHAMQHQKQEARKHWSGTGAEAQDKIWATCAATCGSTEFIGYQDLEGSALIQALIHDHQRHTSVTGPLEVDVVTAQTPFYGTSGGQIGDTGELVLSDGHRLIVSATQKHHGIYSHRVHLPEGVSLHEGQEGRWYVDQERRMNIRRHHSATHLLHAALRNLIGSHVIQKGSLVEPHRLRFDFSHHQPLTLEEKQAVEDWVNGVMLSNVPVHVDTLPYDQAVRQGAIALFGEKYEDQVRVVSMGEEHTTEPHSVELCGGTHVAQTGDMGLFFILSESSVASGVRRIEAVVGPAALACFRQNKALIERSAALLKCTPTQVPERMAQVIQDRSSKAASQKSLGSEALCETHEWQEDEAMFCLKTGQDLSTETMRRMIDAYRVDQPHGVLVLVSSGPDQGRATVMVGVGAKQQDHYHAVDLVRRISTFLGGKGGGGRPDFAQGGGSDLSKISALPEFIKSLTDHTA